MAQFPKGTSHIILEEQDELEKKEQVKKEYLENYRLKMNKYAEMVKENFWETPTKSTKQPQSNKNSTFSIRSKKSSLPDIQTPQKAHQIYISKRRSQIDQNYSSNQSHATQLMSVKNEESKKIQWISDLTKRKMKELKEKKKPDVVDYLREQRLKGPH